MLDIEKIEYVMKNKTTQDEYYWLFAEKSKLVTGDDIAYVYQLFREMYDMLWNANGRSLYLYENHHRLAKTIEQLYDKLCKILTFDFEKKYLTDKLKICVSFITFFKQKKI